ncbi:agmatine deiminase family protein [Paenibacillus sp. LS1]|uniref:agmatine deiminase family protein n=1 Tax=Paenibacillus sp. LS1 TaxID=2992120 RepID=UPI002231A04E|nr:agmatine deiminase family protein [Paenibacillus sp. LS1]MCW3792666.1 agmatine deiminase family protein [Paenibacillus sp. LS1]
MKRVIHSMLTVGVVSALCFPNVLHAQENLADYKPMSISKRSNFGYTYPAEWEKQKSVWLAWSGIRDANKVSVQIIAALHQNVRIDLIIKDKAAQKEAVTWLKSYNIDQSKVKFHIYEGADIFIRDPGPLFLKTADGKPLIADFNWNGYGIETTRSPYALSLGGIDKLMAKKLGIKTITSSAVAEGGGLEVNGEGALLTFKDTALQRNPGKTLAEIESEYLRMYGQKKVIWLERSPLQDRRSPDDKPLIDNYFGAGANGHVDEVARFINPNTVLVAAYPKSALSSHPLAKSDYQVYEEVAETLRNATDANGKPLTVIQVENPDLAHFWKESTVPNNDVYYQQFGINPGETIYQVPAVSYMNFLISNQVVLIPKYWKKGLPESIKNLDNQFKKLMQSSFPGYKIVQIDPLAVNFMGGGMHCITQQMPTY